MLPVTVQCIVAMLAYALTERVVRTANSLLEESQVLKVELQVAAAKGRIPLPTSSDGGRRSTARRYGFGSPLVAGVHPRLGPEVVHVKVAPW